MRAFINKKYEQEIDGLYGEEECLFIDSCIIYQDGRKSTLNCELKIRSAVSTGAGTNAKNRQGFWTRLKKGVR